MKWAYQFTERDPSYFLELLTDHQAQFAKVCPGRKEGYAIYGWDIWYPVEPAENA